MFSLSFLDRENIPEFLKHLLERVDWQADLHFQTGTTIDTLDYSGTGLNEGSKLVIAAAGPKRRELPTEISGDFSLPDGFRDPRISLPGVLAIQAPPFTKPQASMDNPQSEIRNPKSEIERFCNQTDVDHPLNTFPFIVLVDDSQFTSESLNNFLWVTFTRSNPAADVHGIGSFIHQKHWGCTGPLVIDARIKPRHAPPLIDDPEITARVEQLAAPGGPLHGVF